MKRLIASIFCGLVAATAVQAADTWKPTGPVKIIVGYAAGGGADFSARVVADKMSEYLRTPVIVENKPGAGAGLAMQTVKNSPANGLILGVGSPSPLGTNFVFSKDPGYDPIKDFDAVGTIFASPRVMITNSAIPATKFQEVVSVLKNNPNKFYFGGTTNGADQIHGEVFKKNAGVQITFVGYKGGAPALADFLGGHINMMFDIMPSLLPHIQSGKANLVAVGWHTRLKEFPDVPTWGELGYHAINDPQWYNLIAPKGTPKETINTLNAALKYALNDPGVKEKILKGVAYPIGDTPTEAQMRVERTYKSMLKVGQELNLAK
jgi:tripartite-type tricarboxylate transporter receptor subunit TctC